MIAIQRPGQDPLEIDFILLDFEGTLAADRRVHPKAKDKINLLAKRVKVYILAKGEEAAVGEVLRKVKADVVYLKEGQASQEKLKWLRQLGEQRTVAIGNGVDDAWVVERAALGICVLSKEGTAPEVVAKADLVVMDILDALDFLLKPLRQKATLSK